MRVAHQDDARSADGPLDEGCRRLRRGALRQTLEQRPRVRGIHAVQMHSPIHIALTPPSMTISAPVMKRDSSDAR